MTCFFLKTTRERSESYACSCVPLCATFIVALIGFLGTLGCHAIRPKCGLSSLPHRSYMRIIGGRSTLPGEWPWQVALLQKDPYSGKGLGQPCGGALIHPAWVLTAAHCMVDPILKFVLPPPFWTVKVGEVSLSPSGAPQNAHEVTNILLHKGFNRRTWAHDIALVKLRHPVNLKSHKGLVNTICLPSVNASFQGHQCAVAGWGRTKSHGNNADILQTARVPVLPDARCQRAYKEVNPVTDGMMCAGWDDGIPGPCVGDSGGPLQCREDGGPWVHAGVTSWGVGCARPGYPGVYIRVTDYLDWILSHINKS